MSRNTIVILAVLIGAVAVLGLVFANTGPKPASQGISVGSPIDYATTTATAVAGEKITQAVALHDSITPLYTTITPLEVMEDSRCPTDVQCIQAGTVRVRVRAETANGTYEYIFKLGERLINGSEHMDFTDVSPARLSTHQILPAEYRFTFVVSL